MIVQFSTGGRSGAGQERGGMLPLRPDMASLTVGSNNFPTRVYENPPDLVDWLAAEMLAYDIKPEIEAFDLSHICTRRLRWRRTGGCRAPLYVQFVMGVKNAMPADRDVFDYYVKTVKRLMPGAEWCAAGIGPTPDRAERMVRRQRRPCADRAGGQPPPRPGYTGAVERRPRAPRGRSLRAIRTAGGQPRRGAADAGVAGGLRGRSARADQAFSRARSAAMSSCITPCPAPG